MNPQLMLFDEATSALDRELVRDVLGVMKDLAEQHMTMIIVSHELGFAEQVARRIIYMDEADRRAGKPEEVLHRPGRRPGHVSSWASSPRPARRAGGERTCLLAAGSYSFDWTVSGQLRPLLRALGITFKISIPAEIPSLVIGLGSPSSGSRRTSRLPLAGDRLHRRVPRGAAPRPPHLALLRRHDPHRAELQRAPGRRASGLGLLYGANLAEVFSSGPRSRPRRPARGGADARALAPASPAVGRAPPGDPDLMPPLGNPGSAYEGLDAGLDPRDPGDHANGSERRAHDFRPFEIYTTVAAIYLRSSSSSAA